MNHTGKRKLVRSRATVAALEDAGYEMNGIGIVDGTVFAGQLIVDPLSAGGQRFIEDFYDAKWELSGTALGDCGRSHADRQDAFGILSSCFLLQRAADSGYGTARSPLCATGLHRA